MAQTQNNMAPQAFNSLFEMQLGRALELLRRKKKAFNSLFEMHGTFVVQKVLDNDKLSILYLRCVNIPRSGLLYAYASFKIFQFSI